MAYIKEIATILGGYLLGCFSTGYYLVRFSTGSDIRVLGSGSAGAINVSRKLGIRGFALTFLGDVIKGTIAVGVALYLRLDPLVVMLVLVAVVAGHIWPVQLRFRGGKGVATAFGALIALDYKLALVLLLLAGIIFVLMKRFTLSGLVAITLSPAIAIIMGHPPTNVIGIAAMALIILTAHRANIHTIFKMIYQAKGRE